MAILGQARSRQFNAIDAEIKEEKIPVFGPLQSAKVQSENVYTYNTVMTSEDQSRLYVKRVLDLYKGPGKPKMAFFGVKAATSTELLDYLDFLDATLAGYYCWPVWLY